MGPRILIVQRFRHAPLSKKLALVGAATALCLLTMLIGNHFLPKGKAVTRQIMGHDFLAFYTAGTFVREGRSHQLYSLDAVRDFQQPLARKYHLDIGSNFAPWWNPPFYALAFEPLSKLPYLTALRLWRAVNLVALLTASLILMGMIGRSRVACLVPLRPAPCSLFLAPSSRRWRVALLVPLLLVVSMPFIQALSHGQNTMISLLLLVGTVALWRAKRGVLAGLVAGLLFYKPQLGAVVAVVMLLDLGIASFIGLAITGIILLSINSLVLPGTLMDWLHQLPANVKWFQIDHVYLWERHVTLKAFWRLLLQGRTVGEPKWYTTMLTYITVAIFGIRLLRSAWLVRRDRQLGPVEPVRRDRLIAATITVMPLLMPFYFDYDLMLMAVPATLLAIDQINRPNQINRRLTAAWIALGAWLYLNPALALWSHVDVTVLLLSAVAWMSLDRARRGGVGANMVEENTCESDRSCLAA